jgi:hypothetical protein
MTHPETAIAALFDHEQELEAPARGRRRPAPDWGGDELFSSTPRRRRPRQRVRDIGEHHLYAVPAPEEFEFSHAGPAPETPHRAALELIETAELELPAPAEDVEAHAHVVTHTETPPPAGRRTVTITGHPEPRVIRTRRPAPTVDQRIGHRPDRIAGWAFALGMLLILIAILTAHMG